LLLFPLFFNAALLVSLSSSEAKSFAFGVQFGGRSDDSALRKFDADAWFDRPCVARLMVRDQVVRYLTEFPAGSDDLSAL
jgi:hypothetical protein